MAAASYRQSSPIIGFSGHLPGSKFHIGSTFKRVGTAYPKSENGTMRESRRTQRSTSRSRRDENGQTEMNESVAGYDFDDDGNPVPQMGPLTQRSYRSGQNQFESSQIATSPVFQIPVQFVHAPDASTNSLQIPVHPNMLANTMGTQTAGGTIRTAMSGSRSVHDLNKNTDRLSIHNDQENGDIIVGSRASNRSTKKRSKSAASKKRQKSATKADEWQDSGLGGGAGFWSEGQSLRNLRRHREMNGLPPYTAADRIENEATSGIKTPKTGRQSEAVQIENGDGARTPKTGRSNENGPNRIKTMDRLGRTPAPGYTGHLIEMHRLQIGKNYTDAAKESRKLQQSYKDSLNGSFMTTRSHSPTARKRSASVRNATQQSRRSQN